MTWVRRSLLATPFAIAAVLNCLLLAADKLHWYRERVAGYCFLFGTPWGWLLDHDWFGTIHNRLVNSLIVYAIILWIPALLYSACLWFLVRLVERLTGATRG
jgi:hypothetical protein